MARRAAHVCVATPHDDLQGCVDVALDLAERDPDALAPYGENSAEAYEGLRAVLEHLPNRSPTPGGTPS